MLKHSAAGMEVVELDVRESTNDVNITKDMQESANANTKEGNNDQNTTVSEPTSSKKQKMSAAISDAERDLMAELLQVC